MDVKHFKFEVMNKSRLEDGSLIALEGNKNIPFEIKRIFYIYGVNSDISRGAHAHKESKQILICIRGRCEILLDNAQERKIVELNSPNIGLLQDSMVWGEMHNFLQGSILMVLSDSLYDPNDYIRDYSEFLRLSAIAV